MTSNEPAGNAFRAGDEVVLAQGSYQGTPGVFLRFRRDANWTEIKERDGNIRSHPVVWLAPSTKVAWGNRQH